MKLGHWHHSWKLSALRKLFVESRKFPCSSSIAQILSAHHNTLEKLCLQNEEDIAEMKDSNDHDCVIPAMREYMFSESLEWRFGMSGDLSQEELLMICYWLRTNLKFRANKWYTSPALYHAITLVLAKNHQMTLIEAWNFQKSYPKGILRDVDTFALAILEERIFDCSSKAGWAGNCQWGLDVGPSEDNWNPYEGGPEKLYLNMLLDDQQTKEQAAKERLVRRIACDMDLRLNNIIDSQDHFLKKKMCRD
jgi:hypothetical protein